RRRVRRAEVRLRDHRLRFSSPGVSVISRRRRQAALERGRPVRYLCARRLAAGRLSRCARRPAAAHRAVYRDRELRIGCWMRRPTVRGWIITIWISGFVNIIVLETVAIRMHAPVVVMFAILIVVLAQTLLFTMIFRFAAQWL